MLEQGALTEVRASRLRPVLGRLGRPSAAPKPVHPSEIPESRRRRQTAPTSGLFFFEEQRINKSGQSRTNYWGDPKEPELMQRPAVHEKRRSGAAGRVHRQVVNGYADQVNEREAKANGNSRKPQRCATIRSAHNDEQEEESEHNLRHETSTQ